MRGLRIVRGYVQVRIMHQGQYYHKNFGPDCELARELAEIHLSEKRKEILMGKFGIVKEIPTKTFAEAAQIWLIEWSKEINPDGTQAHGPNSIKEVHRVIQTSLSNFSARAFEKLRPLDIELWRESLLKSGCSGTSVNRYQAVLSSIFNGLERWIKTERIKAFQIPSENPCDVVEKAPNVKRKRVLSVIELKNLKAACVAMNDADLWEICEMALKSLLRKKDLFRLESGIDIDTIQAKTNRSIHLPVQVLRPLRYANFRKRWEAVRKAARLIDCQFRDLRKTGANLLKMRNHSNKMISEFLGHASTQTTEIYMVSDASHLKPLAKDLEDILKGL